MTIQTIENWVGNNETEIFAFLKKIVDINSFSGNDAGLIQTGDAIVDWGHSHGFEFKKIKNIHNPKIFHLYLEGRSQIPYFGLLGHFDTVHSPESHFQRLGEEGDKLVGPGVMDMKGGLVVALYTLAILRDIIGQKDLPVRVVFNCDEEIGSTDSRKLIEDKLREAKGAFVLEGRYASDNAIVTARRGIIMGRVKVTGKAAHSGENPQDGVNAILEMSEKIVRLNKLNDQGAGTTVSVNRIKGGSAANIIADHCQAEIDIRFGDSDRELEIINRVSEILDRRFVPGTRISHDLNTVRPAMVCTPASSQLRDLYFESSEEFGLPFAARSAGGGSDANLISAIGVPTLDSLGPVGGNPHTSDEYVIKSSILNSIKVFSLLFAKLCDNQVKKGG
jgi:glutamate carboxypeptidase